MPKTENTLQRSFMSFTPVHKSWEIKKKGGKKSFVQEQQVAIACDITHRASNKRKTNSAKRKKKRTQAVLLFGTTKERRSFTGQATRVTAKLITSSLPKRKSLCNISHISNKLYLLQCTASKTLRRQLGLPPEMQNGAARQIGRWCILLNKKRWTYSHLLHLLARDWNELTRVVNEGEWLWQWADTSPRSNLFLPFASPKGPCPWIATIVTKNASCLFPPNTARGCFPSESLRCPERRACNGKKHSRSWLECQI